MFITFIYRIRGNPTTCYGKFIFTHLSDDHDGLDAEMRSVLVNALNRQREKEGLGDSAILREEQVTLGIFSVSSEQLFPIYSTEEEIQVFDFYYKSSGYLYDSSRTYLNGVLIE
jgi:hypothetical protein